MRWAIILLSNLVLCQSMGKVPLIDNVTIMNEIKGLANGTSTVVAPATSKLRDQNIHQQELEVFYVSAATENMMNVTEEIKSGLIPPLEAKTPKSTTSQEKLNTLIKNLIKNYGE